MTDLPPEEIDQLIEAMKQGFLERLADVEAERDKLASLLYRIHAQNDESCRYDHNGFCQSHYYSLPCVFEEVRAILSKQK